MTTKKNRNAETEKPETKGTSKSAQSKAKDHLL